MLKWSGRREYQEGGLLDVVDRFSYNSRVRYVVKLEHCISIGSGKCAITGVSTESVSSSAS